jgi:hypothetical protein
MGGCRFPKICDFPYLIELSRKEFTRALMLILETFVIDMRRNGNVGLLLFQQIEQLLYGRPIPNRHGPSRGGSRQKRRGAKMYRHL